MTRSDRRPTESCRRTTWHDLPMEVIIEIIQYLWTRDAIALSSTCQLYHASLSDMILTTYIRRNPRPRAERLLAWAVDHDSISFAKKVLNLGVAVTWARDVTVRTPSQQLRSRCRAPLLRSIQRNNLEMVELLLQHGADVLTRNEDDTAMTLAMRLDSLDIAACLLEHAASLSARNATTGDELPEVSASSLANSRPIDFEIYALHHAAKAGHIPAIQLLLDHGAYIDVCDARGNTPLHVAIAESQTAGAKILLERGADITAQNNAGRDALSLAARMPKATTEQRIDLVLKMVDIWKTSTRAAHDKGRRLGISDAQASELLASGQASIIKFVLDAGYHPDCTSSSSSSSSAPSDQGTPLWTCASLRAPPWGDGPESTDGVQLLIDAGADVNFAHPVTLETPAMRAARHGRDDVLRLLISHGADITTAARDRQGKTVLAHAATARTGITPLRTLLDQHTAGAPSSIVAAQLEAPDTKGRTPLIQALAAGRFTPAAMLVEAGVDVVHCRDEHGRSALCLAAQRHPLGPAELILARLAADGVSAAEGIDAMADVDGDTPLAQAVRWNCRGGALLLIAAGADVDVASACRETSYRGGEVVTVREWEETPLTVAVRRNDVVLVRALLEAGASVRRAMEGVSQRLWRGVGAVGRDDIAELLERFRALEVETESAARGRLDPSL